MQSHIKKYEPARWALSQLGVSDKYPHFLPITRTDTKAVTAVFDPNKRGDRNAGMSWIWRRHGTIEPKLDVDSDSKDGTGIDVTGSDRKGNEYLKEGEFIL